MCGGGSGNVLKVLAVGALAATGLGLAGIGPMAGMFGAEAAAAGVAGGAAGGTGLSLGAGGATGLTLGSSGAAGLSASLAGAGFDAGIASAPAGGAAAATALGGGTQSAGTASGTAAASGEAGAGGADIMGTLKAGAQLAPLASLAMMAGGNPKMAAQGVPTPDAAPVSQAAQTPAPNIFKKKLQGTDSTLSSGPGGVSDITLGRATVLGS